MSLYQSKQKHNNIRQGSIHFLVQVQLRGESSAGEHVRRPGAGRVPRLLPGGLRVPHPLVQGHLHVLAEVGNIRRSVELNLSVSHVS